MWYNSAYNDFLSGLLIDQGNFRNLFGVLYCDLRNQEDDLKDDLKDSGTNRTEQIQPITR